MDMTSTTSAAGINDDMGHCGDSEDESNLGGISQAVMDTFERVVVHADDDGRLAEVPEMGVPSVQAGSESFPSRSCRSGDTIATDSPQQERKEITEIAATALSPVVRSSQSLPNEYDAVETQSPMNVAICSKPQIKAEKQSVEIMLNIRDDKKPTMHHNLAVTDIAGAYKKASTRNTQVGSKTTDRVRRGEAGPRTFTAADLFLPGGTG
jgi:hypothetical protein